ncbi:hypothetical protein NL676_020109 [Syzygium grande]|nr:hypothetical protein NL676_020109 [Syzygium grande]
MGATVMATSTSTSSTNRDNLSGRDWIVLRGGLPTRFLIRIPLLRWRGSCCPPRANPSVDYALRLLEIEERGLGFGESEGFELAEMGLEVGGQEGAVDGEGRVVDRGVLLKDVEVLGLGNEVFHRQVISVR